MPWEGKNGVVQIILEVLPGVLKLWINVLPSMLMGCPLANLFRNTAFLHRLGQSMRPREANFLESGM